MFAFFLQKTTDCCVSYLEDKISDISTPYAAAIVCYTLSLAKSKMAAQVCGKMDSFKKNRGEILLMSLHAYQI